MYEQKTISLCPDNIFRVSRAECALIVGTSDGNLQNEALCLAWWSV